MVVAKYLVRGWGLCSGIVGSVVRSMGQSLSHSQPTMDATMNMGYEKGELAAAILELPEPQQHEAINDLVRELFIVFEAQTSRRQSSAQCVVDVPPFPFQEN